MLSDPDGKIPDELDLKIRPARFYEYFLAYKTIYPDPIIWLTFLIAIISFIIGISAIVLETIFSFYLTEIGN